MYQQSKTNPKENVGKIIPIFIPYHKLNTIKKVKRNAHLSMQTVSEYARELFDKDDIRISKQQAEIQSWSTTL